MKMHDKWRSYLTEFKDNLSTADSVMGQEFSFSEGELKKLNGAIARVVEAAKKVLGAEGITPSFQAGDSPSMGPESLSEQEGEEYTEEEIQQAKELGISPYQLRRASPEQLGMRSQYYSAGGEIDKYGPRAVRNLEKGLGLMGAEDFEEAGIVMKVPESVLEDFRVLVDSTKQVDGLFEEARDWYHNIRKLLDDETNNDRDSALLGMLIATYSPRAKFALNLVEAVFMYKAIQKDVQNGKTERLLQYLETFPGSEKRVPGSFRGFTNASKVPNFALNLIAPALSGKRGDSGAVEYDEMYEWNSTIDTWMIDAFYPTLRKASTAKEWGKVKGKLMSNVVSYRYMARLVAKEARNLNLLPHELQALIWVASQIRQTGSSGLGVTTQFAFDQIRLAITNVANIREDLQTLINLKNDDWLKTITRTIDYYGFEQAGRFVKEKGMGVRSITSRGKKGDMFQYFPTPEKVKGVKKTSKATGAAKPIPAFKSSDFEDLYTHYVMNNIIQMPSRKFNNLYDSITLYVSSDFSTEKAVNHVLGRFDPKAKSTKAYFLKEDLLDKKTKERFNRLIKMWIKKRIKNVI